MLTVGYKLTEKNEAEEDTEKWIMNN